MYPIIFKYKMLTIGGYGIMLGLAFYLGFLLVERELKLHDKDPEIAYKALLLIVPSAIIGAKIFHIVDFFGDFLRDPIGMILSGSGLSVMGGFILSFFVAIVLFKKIGESIPQMFDFFTPGMAFSYGVGRLGCHVAGDPCYGVQTATFIGTPYPNGLAPVSVPVFPTPLFESFMSFVFFFIIMRLRKKEMPLGMLFSIYLILHGFARLMVEFLRTNPKVLSIFTQSQVIGIIFIIVGSGLVFFIKKNDQKNKQLVA